MLFITVNTVSVANVPVPVSTKVNGTLLLMVTPRAETPEGFSPGAVQHAFVGRERVEGQRVIEVRVPGLVALFPANRIAPEVVPVPTVIAP